MSEVMGEGPAYGEGDPERLGYEYLIDRARSGTVVVLLPSVDEEGEGALACTTFDQLSEDDELELVDADALVRAARLVQLSDDAYNHTDGAEPWAGNRAA
ncbi:MAG TPA: hypothetical protein VF032_16030 [Thermoleophilaceae bacterium]